MSLHPNTFDYLRPLDHQLDIMAEAREAAKAYADEIERLVPNGPDKTYLLRKLREVAMWVNIAITRHADGCQRLGVPLDLEAG